MKFAIIACAAVLGAQAIDTDNDVERYGSRGGYGGCGLNRGYGGSDSYAEPKQRSVDYGSGFRIQQGRNVYNKTGKKVQAMYGTPAHRRSYGNGYGNGYGYGGRSGYGGGYGGRGGYGSRGGYGYGGRG